MVLVFNANASVSGQGKRLKCVLLRGADRKFNFCCFNLCQHLNKLSSQQESFIHFLLDAPWRGLQLVLTF